MRLLMIKTGMLALTLAVMPIVAQAGTLEGAAIGAGSLAGQIVQGAGFGLIGDVVVGIIGAFVGSWLLPQFAIHLGSGMVPAIVNATIGAVLLLFVLRLVGGGRRFGGWGWGRRW